MDPLAIVCFVIGIVVIGYSVLEFTKRSVGPSVVRDRGRVRLPRLRDSLVEEHVTRSRRRAPRAAAPLP